MSHEHLSFSHALELLKEGRPVTRCGWNGKNMFIYLVPGNEYPAQTEIAKNYFGERVPYGPYIAMKTAQEVVVPWLASQSDMLSGDWMIFEPKGEK
jgi:hypothetical protein